MPILTWADVDPSVRDFDPSQAYTLALPLVPTTRPSDDVWTQSVSQAFVSHYGKWACGWHYGMQWMFSSDHSFSKPEVNAAQIQGALIQWRQWLEKLAVRFHALKPLPDADLTTAFEHAAVLLINDVVEYTRAGDDWPDHCEQVLGWFFEVCTVDVTQEFIEAAIDERFRCWDRPKDEVVRAVAREISIALSKIVKSD